MVTGNVDKEHFIASINFCAFVDVYVIYSDHNLLIKNIIYWRTVFVLFLCVSTYVYSIILTDICYLFWYVMFRKLIMSILWSGFINNNINILHKRKFRWMNFINAFSKKGLLYSFKRLEMQGLESACIRNYFPHHLLCFCCRHGFNQSNVYVYKSKFT